MPTSLSLQKHLDALRHRGAALAEHAESAGLDADVPTCPDWSVAHLVAHMTMVHRWATGYVTRAPAGDLRDDDDIRANEADLLAYYLDGHQALLDVLAAAPASLDVKVFLDGAPAPREFWARRQAHETTMHAVDALAAALGRWPTADEVGLETAFAVDGLDELVCGFLPNRGSGLFRGESYVISLRPEDSEQNWSITVGPELDTRPGQAEYPAATFIGSSAQLYLGLWNRGDEITVEGDPELLDRWRAAERINWG